MGGAPIARTLAHSLFRRLSSGGRSDPSQPFPTVPPGFIWVDELESFPVLLSIVLLPIWQRHVCVSVLPSALGLEVQT